MPAARAVTDEDAAQPVLRAMIAAMKADGRLDDAERATLTQRLSADGVTQAEVDFVNAELAYRRALAQVLRLPPQVVAALHRMTGAPMV